MKGDDHTRDQVTAVYVQIRRQLAYLARLRERMLKAGFPPTDPLYLLVEAAYNGIHRLSVDLHYRSCLGGTFRMKAPATVAPATVADAVGAKEVVTEPPKGIDSS